MKTKTLAAAAVAGLLLAGWAVGYWMGGSGGQRGGERSSATMASPSRQAGHGGYGASANGRAPTGQDQSDPARASERRGKALAALIAASQLPDGVKKFRDIAVALS